MEQLKMEIYWRCENLRKMYTLGLENSPRYIKELKIVQDLSKKYEEAKELSNKFFEKCANTPKHK